MIEGILAFCMGADLQNRTVAAIVTRGADKVTNGR